MATIAFLGAAGTVTGSKYLITTGGRRVLVDCGLFQGLKELRQRNWDAPFPDPASLDAVILTHAHIDHTGYLPRLVRQGFRGPVYASPGTTELCQLLLPDSGHLQEEDAEMANAGGYSKHRPALPLYTEADAREALRQFRPVPYEERKAVFRDLAFRFVPAGHILGSSFVELDIFEGTERRRLVMSGDLGRYDVPILEDPSPVPEADFIVVESTYGNRRHADVSVKDQLAEVVGRAAARGGRIVIPAFAVGRTQEVLYYLRELETERRIPILPVMVDSPMAQAATESYRRGSEDHDAAMRRLLHKHIEPLQTHRFSFGQRRGRRRRGSVKEAAGPRIIISASGMATGGRVLSHLAECLPDPRSVVVFVGFQAAGTRGRRLLEGEPAVKIHGKMVPVKAEIASISGLSAHADYEEALRWLSGFGKPPRRVYVTHGEPEAAEAMRTHIASRLGWQAVVPKLGQVEDLMA